MTADDKFILPGDSQPAYTATIGDLVLRDRGREAELITYPTPTCPTYADAEGTYIVTFVPGTLYVDATARVGSLWITDHENLDDGTVYLAIKPTLSNGELTADTVVALAAENKIKAAWATNEEDLKSAVPQPVELRDPTGELDLEKGWIWVKVPVDLGEQAKGRPVIWTVTIDR